MNFANGLDFVAGRGTESMTAKEALEYLTALDRSVTSAMYREGVDRALYKRWSGISLGPAFEKTKLAFEHNRYEMRFDPKITLTSVRMKYYRGRPNPNRDTSRIYVALSGYVIGDDIRRLELVDENGLIKRNIKLSSDPRGYRFFKLGQVDGKRIWTLRARDKYDEVVEKAYNFASVAGVMPLDRNDVQLPFRMVYASSDTFRARDVDPRLDAYFKFVNNPEDGYSEENSMFSRF